MFVKSISTQRILRFSSTRWRQLDLNFRANTHIKKKKSKILREKLQQSNRIQLTREISRFRHHSSTAQNILRSCIVPKEKQTGRCGFSQLGWLRLVLYLYYEQKHTYSPHACTGARRCSCHGSVSPTSALSKKQ